MGKMFGFSFYFKAKNAKEACRQYIRAIKSEYRQIKRISEKDPDIVNWVKRLRSIDEFTGEREDENAYMKFKRLLDDLDIIYREETYRKKSGSKCLVLDKCKFVFTRYGRFIGIDVGVFINPYE